MENTQNNDKGATSWSSKIQANTAAPLYITVGPPACGKSTWLSQHRHEGRHAVCDIALDDQDGVYIAMDTQYFLSTNNGAVITKDDNDKLLDEERFGQTLRERLERDNAELKLVAKRSAGLLTRQEFAAEMATCLGASGDSVDDNSPALLQTVLTSYEEVFFTRDESNLLRPPETTDLFIRQAIFQPSPGAAGNQSALDRTRKALFSASPQQPVAWGNTNIKAKDYRVALQMAARQQRPVYFVVYNALNNQNENENENDGGMEVELEGVGFEGLLKRNLGRYLDSGRYVPAKVIQDMMGRASTLLKEVWQRRQPGEEFSKLQRDQILARLAGFNMKENRTVVELPPQPSQQQQQPRDLGDRRWGDPQRPGPGRGEWNAFSQGVTIPYENDRRWEDPQRAGQNRLEWNDSNQGGRCRGPHWDSVRGREGATRDQRRGGSQGQQTQSGAGRHSGEYRSRQVRYNSYGAGRQMRNNSPNQTPWNFQQQQQHDPNWRLNSQNQTPRNFQQQQHDPNWRHNSRNQTPRDFQQQQHDPNWRHNSQNQTPRNFQQQQHDPNWRLNSRNQTPQNFQQQQHDPNWRRSGDRPTDHGKPPSESGHGGQRPQNNNFNEAKRQRFG